MKGKNNIIINTNFEDSYNKGIYTCIEKLIDNNENIIVLDSNRRIYEHYYDELKSKKYNIVFINLTGGTLTEGYNPLLIAYKKYKENNIDDAINILSKLSQNIFVDDNSMDKFWDNASADLFVGASLYLFEKAKENQINLTSVYNVANELNSTNGLKLLEKFSNEKAYANIFLENILNMPHETKGGVYAVFNQKLRLIVSRVNLSKTLGTSTFKLKNKTIIFLIDSAMHTLPSTRIVLSSLVEEFKDNNLSLNIILPNIDEITNLYDFKEDYVSSRQNNIKYILVTKDLDYFKHKYGSYIFNISDCLNTDAIDTYIKDKISDNLDYPKELKVPIHEYNLKK